LFFDVLSGQDTKDMSNVSSKAKSFFSTGAANPMDRYLLGNSGSGD
jgi:hypothetical protein